MDVSVDVVIPAHGGWPVTERCLRSLEQRDRCVREVIVVDDASPDDTAAHLRRRSDVRAVYLATNMGFSAACNAGVAQARASAVLFLNNDTIVPRGSIERMARALQGDETIGAVGAKLLYADDTIQSAGCALTNRGGGTWRLFAHLDGTLEQANRPGDFCYLAGAALMVRTEVLRQTGGFDERFRNGAEDVDLCLRLWRAGHRVHYVPDAAIYHIEGASRGKSFDEANNWKQLEGLWPGKLLAMPHYQPDPLPDLLVRWRARTPLERQIKAHAVATMRRYAGMRLIDARVPGARLFCRARAALERKPLIALGSGECNDSAILWTARHDADAPFIWAPSAHVRDAMVDAGVDEKRISVVRLGFSSEPSLDRAQHAVIVTDRSISQHLVAEIERALLPRRAIVIDADFVDAAAIEIARRAVVAVFASRGDAWGYVGGLCLAAGVPVIARSGSPFLELMPAEASIVTGSDGLADAARTLDEGKGALIGATGRLESTLRASAIHSGSRVRELVRSYVWGVPDPRAFEMRIS